MLAQSVRGRQVLCTQDSKLQEIWPFAFFRDLFNAGRNKGRSRYGGAMLLPLSPKMIVKLLRASSYSFQAAVHFCCKSSLSGHFIRYFTL